MPWSCAVSLIGGLLILPTHSSAQYFGQNKVQYRKLDFKVLRTEHFDIYFYPEERAGTDIAAQMAERWYARLSRFFHHELRGRQPLIVYASPTDFQQTNVIPGDGWCHRAHPTPHRPAARRAAGRYRSRPRARARACLSVRHHDAGRRSSR